MDFVDKLKELVEGLCLAGCYFLEIDICSVAQDLSEKVLALLLVEQEIL